MHSLHYSGRKSIYFIQLLVTAFFVLEPYTTTHLEPIFAHSCRPFTLGTGTWTCCWCAVQINRVLSKNFLLFCKFAKSFT